MHENFIKKLGEQVEAEISDILAKAEAEKKEIISVAEKKAEHFKTAPLAELKEVEMACRMSVSNRRSKGGEVKLNVDALVLAEKNIAGVFTEAGENLEDLKKKSNYKGALKTLVEEALDGVGDDVVLSANKDDMQNIKKILADTSISIEFKVDDSILGGLAVSSKDGRIKNINTLSSRLDRMKNFVVKDVNRVLHDKSE